MNQKLQTKFAPAERESQEKILSDYEMIRNFELISKLFTVIPNIVMILNKERQTVFCNTALLVEFKDRPIDTILGLRPGELVNCIHAFEEPGGCGTSDFCKVCGAVNAILETQYNKVNSVRECRISVRNGNNIEALDIRVSTNILELNGENFVTFHITDISDIKRKSVLERVFFHDIMNTVGIIRNLTELAKESDDKDSIENYLDKLISSTNRLINELKCQQELIKAENNELISNFYPLSPKDLLSTLKYQYENHSVSTGKTIKIDEPINNDIILESDAVLLGRVLGNLIKNALEAIHEGQEICIGYNSSITLINFLVYNPSYIPEEVQLQIFQRSFSTKGPGRGIGTYSIRLFTEKYLKGKVSFFSSPAEGTTFTVTLPLVP